MRGMSKGQSGERPKFHSLVRVLSVLAVLSVIAALSLLKPGSSASQPLSVTFVGYSNAFAGPRWAAVFVVSNRSSRVVKRWGGVYLERAPFATNSSPKNWVWAANSAIGDSLLKPGQAEQLIVGDDPPSVGWRLRVPWAWGTRARIALALRAYSFVPNRLKAAAAQEYYAHSDPVPVRE